jgi:hypothetical protein
VLHRAWGDRGYALAVYFWNCVNTVSMYVGSKSVNIICIIDAASDFRQRAEPVCHQKASQDCNNVNFTRRLVISPRQNLATGWTGCQPLRDFEFDLVLKDCRSEFSVGFLLQSL